jgi:UDP-3-O-[3-hydroxymyristoyl] N-acetylglucosamine deacetylase
MRGRLQRTIRHSVEATGVGFLSGRDITIRFVPAAANEGIAFLRTDVPGSLPTPARIEFAVPRQRRTAIERHGVAIEMIEHVMAALAGLRVDNCRVELDGPEPPGFDGSSMAFAEMILAAGTEEQSAERGFISVEETLHADHPAGESEIACRSLDRTSLEIRYRLDYGPRSPIRPQEFSLELTPETFLSDLAFCRTFLLEEEADALRRAGYGTRTTTKDLLVFGPEGPIANALRAADECARHKILDCVGDFALLGCDIYGHFSACRSGHELNREMVRKLARRIAEREANGLQRAA